MAVFVAVAVGVDEHADERGSRAEEQMAGAPPKSYNGHSSAMNSGGDSSLKQKLGEQMKSELVTKIQGTPSGNGWVSHDPKLQISHT